MEVIDIELLSTHIKLKRENPLRQAAQEIGISAPTLMRIERGALPDLQKAIQIMIGLIL